MIRPRTLSKNTREQLSKAIYSLLCSSGLIYQLYLLIFQYMSGKTVVNLKLKRIEQVHLPAITICFPRGISLEKAARFREDLSQVFKNYTDAIRVISDKLRPLNNSERFELEANITQMYYKIINDRNFKSLPVYELFNQYSVSFIDEQKTALIKLYVNGIIENSTEHVQFDFNKIDPIESLNVEVSGILRKCFTFFSALSSKWCHFRINLDQINLGFQQENSWVPANKFYEYFLALHSPNTLPRLKPGDNFIQLIPSTQYSISYSKISTELLGYGYDTDCFEYDLDHKFANFNMRSDCISSCYTSKIENICHHGKLPSSELLLRKQLLFFTKKITLDWVNEDSEIDNCVKINKQFEIFSKCSRQCKFDCNFDHYNWDIIPGKNYGHHNPWLKGGGITIKHNRLPDVLIRHLPETTFISFICNFGEFIGMWLGLSFLVVFDKTIWLLNKYIFVKNNVNNIEVNNPVFNLRTNVQLFKNSRQLLKIFLVILKFNSINI